jgi:hypothetical protein
MSETNAEKSMDTEFFDEVSEEDSSTSDPQSNVDIEVAPEAELMFGVPPKKKPKEDPFKGKMVATICKPPENRGVYKVELSEEAIKYLEFNLDGNDFIGVSFSVQSPVLGNVTGESSIPEKSKTYFAKQGTFSNKNVYQMLKAVLEIEESNEDSHFELKPLENTNVNIKTLIFDKQI